MLSVHPLVRKALLIGKDGFGPLQYLVLRAPLLMPGLWPEAAEGDEGETE